MNELLTCEGLTKSYQKGQRPRRHRPAHRLWPHRGPAWPQRQRQDNPHQTGERPLAAHGGQYKNRGHGPRPGHESHRLLSAGRRMAARLDAGGAAGGDVPGFYADFDPAKANEMLEKLELSPKAPLKSLSKGNKEKVQLILAMSRNARLYLLDEPIGGVDPAARIISCTPSCPITARTRPSSSRPT